MEIQLEKRFNGIYAPLTTPFSMEGEILFDSLSSNVRKYRDSNLSGFLVAGSTGEASHLDSEEIVEILDCVIESASGLPVMAGLNFPSVRKNLEFIRQIESKDVSALLVSTPSYYKNRMHPAALYEFFHTLAEESPVPLLLYNYPRFTGIELEIELIKSLAELPAIAGMKDSSGNLIYMQKVLSATQGMSFQLLSGNAETYGLARTLGVQAAILAICCPLPELAADFQVSVPSAKASYRIMLERVQRLSTLIVGRLGIPGVKYAMDLRGLMGGFCRPPLYSLNKSERTEVEELLQRLMDSE